MRRHRRKCMRCGDRGDVVDCGLECRTWGRRVWLCRECLEASDYRNLYGETRRDEANANDILFRIIFPGRIL
jgi:hypothetical protein